MKHIIKICALAMSLQGILLFGQTNTDAIEEETQDKTSQSSTSENKKTNATHIEKKTDTKKIAPVYKAFANRADLKTTLFVNGRINQILLVITDDKNKQLKVIIKAGMHYSFGHKAQSIKKVVCYELQAPNTTLSKTDLNNYAAFVFNTDQRLEKYHFINIHHKAHAIKRARNAKDEKLALEIEEQNIYHP